MTIPAPTASAPRLVIAVSETLIVMRPLAFGAAFGSAVTNFHRTSKMHKLVTISAAVVKGVADIRCPAQPRV
jgi:hypothetical protein